jgi:hypothetical protein
MGIVITLESWQGIPERTLMDPSRLLNALLPKSDDRTFRCLGFVDEYGDAVFNQLQMPDLIAELERVREKADAEQRELIDQILELAGLCREAPQMQIKFQGD